MADFGSDVGKHPNSLRGFLETSKVAAL